MAVASPIDTQLLAAGHAGMLDPRLLRPHPRNIRHELGDLTDLVESIREKGVIIPLKITTDGLVICGHRRLAAALEAERPLVPCWAEECTEAEQLEAMLIENLQRNGLTPLEEAQGYQQLLDLGESVDDIASATRARAGRIRERTALLQLPNHARLCLEHGWMTLGAAEQLLKLRDHPDYPDIVTEIVNDQIDAEVEADKDVEPIRNFFAVDQALRELQEQRAVAAAREKAEADGLNVVDLPDAYARKKSDPQLIGRGYTDLAVNAKDHAAKDCHAVAITRGGQVVPVCTKPSRHAKEIAAAKKAKASTTEQHHDDPDGVQAADDARFAFVGELLRHAPFALSGRLPLLVVLGRNAYDDEQICKLLGVKTDGFAKASTQFAEWLAGGNTLSPEGEPQVDPAKLAAAATACTFVAIQEAAYDHDPLMALIIRALQHEGYMPNHDELELLEKVPTKAEEWFA